jgi:hypothetical protein
VENYEDLPPMEIVEEFEGYELAGEKRVQERVVTKEMKAEEERKLKEAEEVSYIEFK